MVAIYHNDDIYPSDVLQPVGHASVGSGFIFLREDRFEDQGHDLVNGETPCRHEKLDAIPIVLPAYHLVA